MLTSYCSHPAVSNQNSAIVVITKNAPESKDYSFFPIAARVVNKGNIVYVDTSLNLVHYKLRAVPYDTITIYSNHDNFEIRHDYSAFDCVYYLLNRGDTLFLSYTDKNIPYAKILNRHYNENELNYDYLLAKQFPQPDTLSVLESLNMSFLGDNKMREAAKEKYKNLLYKQMSYLDSLRKNNFISEDQYLYRKNYVVFNIFYNELDSVSNNSFFLSDSLFLKYDPLIYFDFYRRLIDKRLSVSLVNNSQIPCTQVVFNEILHSQNYSNQIKKYIFRLLAINLRKELFTGDLEKLLTDYQTITGDSATCNDLKEQFGILRPEISLKDTDGQSITFSQLLKKFKGNFVYVGYWATWGIPCRDMFSENIKLKNEYLNKNIVFISVAFYYDEKSWLSFISDNPDKFGKENYYITSDTNSSRIIKEWKIKSLPRYMLLDEKGEIALLDAPLPNSKKIRTIFNSLLK